MLIDVHKNELGTCNADRQWLPPFHLTGQLGGTVQEGGEGGEAPAQEAEGAQGAALVGQCQRRGVRAGHFSRPSLSIFSSNPSLSILQR